MARDTIKDTKMIGVMTTLEVCVSESDLGCAWGHSSLTLYNADWPLMSGFALPRLPLTGTGGLGIMYGMLGAGLKIVICGLSGLIFLKSDDAG